eukprot:m51a1_g13215 hypothetical protein (242) ;mRNA; r:117-1168
MSFYKFPRTPHFAGSTVDGDDDQVLTSAQVAAALSSWQARRLRVVVQEKIDGANVGLHYDPDSPAWQPLCQKRSGVLGQHERPQYDVFRTWSLQHAEALHALLGHSLVLFGEWMWSTHAVKYDALPDYLLAFDIMEKETGVFWSTRRMREAVAASGAPVQCVPVLWEGDASPGLSDAVLAPLLKSKSRFGEEQVEGVYIRAESPDRVVERYKLRRPTFSAGRRDFDAHKERNSLASAREHK